MQKFPGGNTTASNLVTTSIQQGQDDPDGVGVVIRGDQSRKGGGITEFESCIFCIEPRLVGDVKGKGDPGLKIGLGVHWHRTKGGTGVIQLREDWWFGGNRSNRGSRGKAEYRSEFVTSCQALEESRALPTQNWRCVINLVVCLIMQ